MHGTARYADRRLTSPLTRHPIVTTLLVVAVLAALVVSVLIGLDLFFTVPILVMIAGLAAVTHRWWLRRRPAGTPPSAATSGRVGLAAVALAGVATFGIIQLVPYGRDHSAPEGTGEPQWADPARGSSWWRRASAATPTRPSIPSMPRSLHLLDGAASRRRGAREGQLLQLRHRPGRCRRDHRGDPGGRDAARLLHPLRAASRGEPVRGGPPGADRRPASDAGLATRTDRTQPAASEPASIARTVEIRSASAGSLSSRYRTTRGEPQRHAAGVPAGPLDTVHRDLDHQRRGNHDLADGRALPVRHLDPGQRAEPQGLPRQQLVGETLERLADHDDVGTAIGQGAKVQVGQPAGAATVAPLGTEHHKVQGVHGLHLAPRGASAARLVGRGRALDHDALVTGVERIGQDPLGDRPVIGQLRRDRPRAGNPMQLGRRRSSGSSIRSTPSRCNRSKKNGRSGPPAPPCSAPASARTVSWNSLDGPRRRRPAPRRRARRTARAATGPHRRPLAVGR